MVIAYTNRTASILRHQTEDNLSILFGFYLCKGQTIEEAMIEIDAKVLQYTKHCIVYHEIHCFDKNKISRLVFIRKEDYLNKT